MFNIFKRKVVVTMIITNDMELIDVLVDSFKNDKDVVVMFSSYSNEVIKSNESIKIYQVKI